MMWGGLLFLRPTYHRMQPFYLRDFLGRSNLHTDVFSPLCMKGKIWNHLNAEGLVNDQTLLIPHSKIVPKRAGAVGHIAQVSKRS